MISIITLQYLTAQNQKDAEALYKQNRNTAAIYLMGYALELGFKRKIVHTLGFVHGFPESPIDFNLYTSQIAAFNAISTGVTLNQLRQIKNHNLNQLIIFSGAESKIKSLFLADWHVVQGWNPEDRYKIKRFKRLQVSDFIRSVKVILREIR